MSIDFAYKLCVFFTEHRIENRLVAGNKGIPTNGESVKVCCPAAVLLFIIRYKNTEPPGQYPEFPGGICAAFLWIAPGGNIPI